MRTRTINAIFAGIVFVALIGYVPVSSAEVSVNIGIGVPLPHVVIHEPPPVVVIPGTYVYFAPDAGMEIFFYHGYWYRPHEGRWYRSEGYNGPWHNVRRHRVPHAVRELPPDYRHRVRHDERIHHRDLKRNWQAWERDKHWDKRDHQRDIRHGRDDRRWGASPRSDDRQWERDRRWDSSDHGREVRNVRDDRRWENASHRDNRQWESDPRRDDRGEEKNVRRDDKEEEKNVGLRGNKAKHNR